MTRRKHLIDTTEITDVHSALDVIEERIFNDLQRIANTFGWELSKRDPGPPGQGKEKE